VGSFITLSVGELEVDWAKNWLGRSHSKLFLPSDDAVVPYHYADDIVEQKPALVRTLYAMRRRLGLLGYSLDGVRTMYEKALDSWPDYHKPNWDFDTFARAIARVNVAAIQPTPEEADAQIGDYDPGEYVTHQIFSAPEFNKVVALRDLPRDVGTFFESLDPYGILRLLLESPSNREALVTWRYADVLDGGWIEEDEISPGLEDSDRYLVVTEGSSDAQILSKAALLVAGDIADFFYFVDMTENYPFTGTGNVYRFCQGLSKIRIQNRVLVVLENDVAGCETYERLNDLNMPDNIKVTKLPELASFKEFSTIGPQGTTIDDVNGKAVSIEMFLDLTMPAGSTPAVRWTTHNDRLQRYQGELLDKNTYAKEFLSARPPMDYYDLTKLKLLWDSLYEACAGEKVHDRTGTPS
jgi:HEPN/Toprim N-terminal domain 1